MRKYRLALIFLGLGILPYWVCAQFTYVTYTGDLVHPTIGNLFGKICFILSAICAFIAYSNSKNRHS